VIRHLGLPLALAALPATAGLLMAGIAARPSPAAVAFGEVLRKVLAYALARPARESLFTVVSREEKYRAKIFMDTVVQRVGDTIAAAAFEALVPSWGFGPSGVAAACVPVCAAWAAVAFRLGQRQQRLAASSH
jgi:AAA family ATP:ADP antiporter